MTLEQFNKLSTKAQEQLLTLLTEELAPRRERRALLAKARKNLTKKKANENPSS